MPTRRSSLFVSGWHPLLAAVSVVGATFLGMSLGISACIPFGPRPCRTDNQCEPNRVCAFADDATIGRCLLPGQDPNNPDNPNNPTDAGDADGGVIIPNPDGDGGTTVNNDVKAKDICVGSNFACAIDDRNRVQCWGANSQGQLGNPDTTINQIFPPRVVQDVSNAADLSCGEEHACVVADGLNGRGIYCWGDAADGQLGGIFPASAGIPTLVVPADGSVYRNLISSQNTTCYIDETDAAFCFGPNRIDNNAVTNRKIADFDTVSSLHVTNGVLCVVADIGEGEQTYCLRSFVNPVYNCVNPIGQFIHCPILDDKPVFALDSSNACTLSTSDNTSAFVCAGDNTYGVVNPAQTNAGNLAARTLVGVGQILLSADGSSNDSSLVLGGQHGCLLEKSNDPNQPNQNGGNAGGVVKCWGRDLYFSLGQNTDVGSSCVNGNARCSAPVVVDIPLSVQLAANAFNVCARTVDGDVFCWGGLSDARKKPPTQQVLAVE